MFPDCFGLCVVPVLVFIKIGKMIVIVIIYILILVK